MNDINDMRIGFIGAGKVGVTLGAYFKENGRRVVGYASRLFSDAKEAAKITGTHAYSSISQLVADCDMIWISTQDGQIASVWNALRKSDIAGRIICHTSGSVSSDVFAGISERGVWGYSVHPMFAFADRSGKTNGLKDICFTIEGDSERIDKVEALISGLGNRAFVIDGRQKELYHLANVMVSNLVTALLSMGDACMEIAGIGNAMEALMPLIRNNINNIAQNGFAGSLTGPVERNDVETIKKHLDVVPPQFGQAYIALSLRLIEIAQQKHPERDYQTMRSMLSGNISKHERSTLHEENG